MSPGSLTKNLDVEFKIGAINTVIKYFVVSKEWPLVKYIDSVIRYG